MKYRVTFLPQNETTNVAEGTTVWQAANSACVPVESICGGRGTCGKCKVRLLDRVSPPTQADRNFLEDAELVAGWRLACRTPVGGPVRVEVPRFVGDAAAVFSFRGQRVPIAPNVHKIVLRLAEVVPAISSPVPSNQERVLTALREAGFDARPVLSVLQALPYVLRPSEGAITAVMCGDEWIAVEPGDTTASLFGLALDIGTTTVVASLVNLRSGSIISEAGLNEQASCGADVITRISYSTQHKDGLRVLQQHIVHSLNRLLEIIIARAGIAREQIYEAVAVGNPTMLHVLLGMDPASIGTHPFRPLMRNAVTVQAAQLGFQLHSEARLSALPHLGGYAGADVIGGLIATELLRSNKLRLYIDVGTNGEVVLGSACGALAAAAPAGPAFEGAEIQCGMRAAAGAIAEVHIAADVQLRVIGDLPPAGICGSGLVDAVAELLRCGIIDPSGRLANSGEVRGKLPDALIDRLVEHNSVRAFLLSSPDLGVVLTQPDIRALQLAKAAVSAAATVLMRRLGVAPQDIHEVLLAGAFGSFLNPASARAIGLVLWLPLQRIVAVGNAAIAGAQLAMLSQREREAATRIPESVEYVELSGHPEFEQIFAEALPFPAPRFGPRAP